MSSSDFQHFSRHQAWLTDSLLYSQARVLLLRGKFVFYAKILHRTNNIHDLYTVKLRFIFKYPGFLCLWWVRKLSQVYSVHPLTNCAHAYLSIVPLLFEVFWAHRPSGYHLFEMHVAQLACFRGHLSQHRHKHQSRERHGGSARWSFAIYTFTNGVIKKNQSSLHSPKVLRPPA